MLGVKRVSGQQAGVGEVHMAQVHRDRRVVKAFGRGCGTSADALPASEGISQMPARAPRVLRDQVPAMLHLEDEFFLSKRGHGGVRHTMALEWNEVIPADVGALPRSDRTRRLDGRPC